MHLFGSGPILNEALRAQKILAEKYQVAADVWSVTSYNELRRDALEVERWNRLHPAEPERKPYLAQALEATEGPIIASTDYMKVVADQIAPWLPGRLVSLGTDGFGRSENREHLRKHFRKRRGSDRCSGAVATGARRQIRQKPRAGRDRGAGVESRKPRPGQKIIRPRMTNRIKTPFAFIRVHLRLRISMFYFTEADVQELLPVYGSYPIDAAGF